MKDYFQVYINHMQNNWMNHLSIAKFTTNNYVNALTKLFLFFANNSFYLQTDVEFSQFTEKTLGKLNYSLLIR